MKTSTTANISSRIFFQYITNVKVDDGSWRGTTSAFLTHWTEQVRIYDDNIESSVTLSDDPKRQFLENIVQNHPEFRNVKSTEDMITALGIRPMTFQQYYDLLQSTAQRYDETMSKNKKPHQSVYMSEITQDEEDMHVDADEGYYSTTPVD